MSTISIPEILYDMDGQGPSSSKEKAEQTAVPNKFIHDTESRKKLMWM